MSAEVVQCVKLAGASVQCDERHWGVLCLFKSPPNRELLLSDMVCLQYVTAAQCQKTSVSVSVVGKQLGTEIQNNTCTFVSISAVAELLAVCAPLSKLDWIQRGGVRRGATGTACFSPLQLFRCQGGFLSPLFCGSLQMQDDATTCSRKGCWKAAVTEPTHEKHM